jgi:hypothetical protein
MAMLCSNCNGTGKLNGIETGTGRSGPCIMCGGTGLFGGGGQHSGSNPIAEAIGKVAGSLNEAIYKAIKGKRD